MIDAIGYFDEDNFPYGFGEENDYCFRALDAGFSLRVATRAYVHHTKTRSYGWLRRRLLVWRGAKALENKYGRARITAATQVLHAEPELARVRRVIREQVADA